MSLDGKISNANVINNLFKNSGVSGKSSFIINRAKNSYLKGNAAQMDIRTKSQWLSKKAITSTNSNNTGTKNKTPAVPGTDRLVEIKLASNSRDATLILSKFL